MESTILPSTETATAVTETAAAVTETAAVATATAAAAAATATAAATPTRGKGSTAARAVDTTNRPKSLADKRTFAFGATLLMCGSKKILSVVESSSSSLLQQLQQIETTMLH